MTKIRRHCLTKPVKQRVHYWPSTCTEPQRNEKNKTSSRVPREPSAAERPHDAAAEESSNAWRLVGRSYTANACCVSAIQTARQQQLQRTRPSRQDGKHSQAGGLSRSLSSTRHFLRTRSDRRRRNALHVCVARHR